MNIATKNPIGSSDSPLGVVGGGQLAQMLGEAAKLRDIEIIVQTSTKDDPAVAIATDYILAKSDDIEGISKLVQRCLCVTFENEWLNIEALNTFDKKGAFFLPSLTSLSPLIDKISQRTLLSELSIPGPSWLPLSSNQLANSKLPIGWQFPLMAKASRGGYDGKGTRVINGFNELEKLIKSTNPEEWLVECWVTFEHELALVASRDFNGKVRTFPLVETHQNKQICDWVLAPATVSHEVEMMAYNIAASLLVELNYIGVLAIEFFYGTQGLLVNEIAPRTHNSAHFSIEACTSSQFDQQVCIAAGLPVPDPKLISPGALMVNLLGLPEGKTQSIEQRLSKLRSCDGVHVHWYGKQLETPGRKLGHATVLLKESDSLLRRDEAIRSLKMIRSIWPSIESDLV